MCFSATASFAAGGALSATGVFTIKQVKVKNELPFASIPFLFGIQQTIEGVIWVSFGLPALNTVMAYAYLVFAYALWPVLIPMAVLLVEPNPIRKNILRIFSYIGFAMGIYLLYFIFTNPSKAHIVNQSIAYDYRHLDNLLPLIPYIVVTCGSGLVSSSKIINIFAISVLIAFFGAYWFYNITFISVWCFFAAILSVIIYWYFRNNSASLRPGQA